MREKNCGNCRTWIRSHIVYGTCESAEIVFPVTAEHRETFPHHVCSWWGPKPEPAQQKGCRDCIHWGVVGDAQTGRCYSARRSRGIMSRDDYCHHYEAEPEKEREAGFQDLCEDCTYWYPHKDDAGRGTCCIESTRQWARIIGSLHCRHWRSKRAARRPGMEIGQGILPRMWPENTEKARDRL